MSAQIIPIDPLDRAIGEIVWRLPLELTAEVDALFKLDPSARILRLIEIITIAAQKDEKVVDVLRLPGILASLKQIALDRRRDHTSSDSDAESLRVQ